MNGTMAAAMCLRRFQFGRKVLGLDFCCTVSVIIIFDSVAPDVALSKYLQNMCRRVG